MAEEKPANKDARGDGEVVYRRLSGREAERRRQGLRGVENSEPRFAPALTPLIVGFTLLLVLVFSLGVVSTRQLDEVRVRILDLQQQHTSRLGLFLELYVASLKLDTEARLRAEGVARREFMSPYDSRLRDERKDVETLLPRLDTPPLNRTSNWIALRRDLATYIETTKDMEAYSSDGFKQFRAVKDELDALEDDLKREASEVSQQSQEIQDKAERKLRLLWASAVVIGLLVIIGTIWEVQRRFRQMQQSVEEARRARQFSTQMLEGMVSAVAAIDARDRIRSANTTFFDIFPDATIGASVHDHLASPDAAKMLEAATASRVEHSTYRGRWMLASHPTPEGTPRTFDVYSSPLAVDNEPGQIITLVDVTAAVEAESEVRRTESLAAVGQASALVAHEIKNPLGSIKLGVSMLRDMTTARDALNTIDLVERGIDHLNKLVVDVTQFSRQKTLSLSTVNLDELLDASLELVADRIQEKRTAVEKNFGVESLQGEWDEDQLRQVFVNLIANAIDASAENSTVTISTTRILRERPGSIRGNGNQPAAARHPFARILIKDQGIGMDEATLEHIFEPFFTTKKRGTGLGLAISKKIVEQHGGAISVASEPGKGTRFTIDLPLTENEK